MAGFSISHSPLGRLLNRHAAGKIAEIATHEDEASAPDEIFVRSSKSLSSPSVPLMDVMMEFLARLRQPFGALLLVPTDGTWLDHSPGAGDHFGNCTGVGRALTLSRDYLSP